MCATSVYEKETWYDEKDENKIRIKNLIWECTGLSLPTSPLRFPPHNLDKATKGLGNPRARCTRC